MDACISVLCRTAYSAIRPSTKCLIPLLRIKNIHTIAVILSGSGSDGTIGIGSVKENGGTIIVQKPLEAQYASMPQSAISTGLVDLTETVSRIGLAIRDYLKNPNNQYLHYDDGVENQELAGYYNQIIDAISKYSDIDFIYPMHLNPNVRKPIHEVFGDDLSNLNNMFFIEPLEYLSFVYLMEKSTLVLTDSGGVQEEAPGLGKPVLVMRDTTERPEAVSAGTVRLVGTDCDKIISAVSDLLCDNEKYESMSRTVNPYGDGVASHRIVKILLEYLK